MSKQFQGTYTALITPFTTEGEIDYPALEQIIAGQIKTGIEGIVFLGTTGESPTISHDERRYLTKFAAAQCKGKTAVIIGTGTNNTQSAIEYSVHAKEDGAEALLIVNPYYNKPTQEGLYRHFSAIAKAVDLPQILYNIKGRTGVNVETATLKRIVRDNKNVVAVKEASGSMEQMKEVIKELPGDFTVLSGDDNLTCELIKNGGDGVVSVLSNMMPKEVKEMVDLGLNGNHDAAKAKHDSLAELMAGCFIETNPIPIKTALAMQGKCEEVFRLPMCPMTEENKAKWRRILETNQML